MTATLTDDQYLTRLGLSVGLRRTGYYTEARKLAMDLVTARPYESSVWHTLAQIWTDTGEFDAALHCSTEAARLIRANGTLATEQGRQQFQAISLGHAIALLRYGKFADAWDSWEAGRIGVSWTPWPGAEYFNGKGKRISYQGSSLLVQSEGGYGDTFMFMRWLPLLKKEFNFARVGLMLWPPLANFCDWEALGIDKVYKIGVDTMPFGEWKHATSVMSLPAVFGMNGWGDIPAISPHYEPFPLPIYGLRQPGEPLRIGFCWRAEENTSPVRTKSLPLETAERIIAAFDPEGTEIYSLSPQKADLYNSGVFQEPAGLRVAPERMTDWRATADYLCSMDYVVTVDTAVAHLAGLLGVPALVLLPRSSCWRWGLPNRTESYWYGSQMKLYRQPEPLQWNAGEITKMIQERLERLGILGKDKSRKQ